MRTRSRAVGLLARSASRCCLQPMPSPADFAARVQSGLSADTRCDSVVCAAVGVFDHGTEAPAAVLETVAGSCDQTAGRRAAGLRRAVDETAANRTTAAELPTFDSATDAIQALAAVTAYAHWRERDPGAVPMLEVDDDAAKRLVNRVLATDRPRSRADRCRGARSCWSLRHRAGAEVPGPQPRPKPSRSRNGWAGTSS